MDVKTLSTVIGHVSSATTLNVYAHVTDEMRQKAADNIDRAITGTEPPQEKELKPPGSTAFQPVKGKYRKPGTGCIPSSMTTCGRAATPPRSTGSAWPGTSTRKQKPSARRSWQS